LKNWVATGFGGSHTKREENALSGLPGLLSGPLRLRVRGLLADSQQLSGNDSDKNEARRTKRLQLSKKIRR
jgi:hypothetical protein